MESERNTAIQQVLAVMQQFQEGYTRRDVAALDAFMELFVPEEDVEVVGTNGIEPGVEEWYVGRAGARELIEGDWQYWGDLALQIDPSRIHVLGDVAWLATHGTVSMRFTVEGNYQDFLDYTKAIIDDEQMPVQEKLLYILRGGTNTVYELHRGEDFVWPIRFSAVLVRREGRWLFHQLHFSFPTTRFPDARVIGGKYAL